VRLPVVLFALFAFSGAAAAQDNYEIQVYGSELVSRGATMVELHSNFTASGRKAVEEGVNATNHAVHETLEVTHGFRDWFETGVYLFTSARSGQGWDIVGSHVRPRFAVPARYHWPGGVSISNEIGYVKREFADATWSWEIRPIVDKQIGKLYLGFNPTFERSFHGPSVHKGVEFSPNFKAGYDITKKINAGLEYYGSLGPVTGFDPLRDQQQQIIPCIDLNLSPEWEFNFGVGVGITQGTDHLLVKMILGRRLGGKPTKN